MVEVSGETFVHRESAEDAHACIVCERKEVETFLDLGETALANKFRTKADLAESEPRYPLRVGFCHECGHVQLTKHVPPHAMFEDYLYVSSASSTLRDHLYDLSDVVVARLGLGSNDLVVDIGCNDGTLLKGFLRHGVRILGVDPARNLAAEGNGEVERYVGFFDSGSAVEIAERWGRAAAMTATNTFPHIPRLHDFVRGLDTVLAPGGAFVIEAHYVVDMLDQRAFDTIYHEHVSYWALEPMQRMFAAHGFEVVNAERLPLHHGQLRATVMRVGEGAVQDSVEATVAMERELGVDRAETFERFADDARRIKTDLQTTLAAMRADGKRIVGYGATAKGNTLLAFAELDRETIEYIADRSSLKQGRYTPNAPIPVVPPERLLEDRPDYVLLLAWNFVDEILEQQADYRRLGGKFIVPVPQVRIVS
jgi:SAM-dependent methyltransferase